MLDEVLSFDEVFSMPLQQKQSEEEQDKLASLAHAVFKHNPLGVQLLEKLRKKYLEAPVCPHNKPSSYGYYREGENSIIRSFIYLIKKHQFNLTKITNQKEKK